MKFKKSLHTILSVLLVSILSLALFTGCTQEDVEFATDELTAVLETESKEDVYEESADKLSEGTTPEETIVEKESTIAENGTYTSKEEVAEYLHTYGHLPSNFIKKK